MKKGREEERKKRRLMKEREEEGRRIYDNMPKKTRLIRRPRTCFLIECEHCGRNCGNMKDLTRHYMICVNLKLFLEGITGEWEGNEEKDIEAFQNIA